VLILTGLSPSAHAAANETNPEAGWWEAMLGPGKADRQRSILRRVREFAWAVARVRPAGLDRSRIRASPIAWASRNLSIEDGANAAFEVVKSLGIEKLACVIGNSMGGMTALAFLKLHPGAARAHINVSGSARALPFSIAIRSLQREAIRLDPAWNHGSYDDEHYPINGMRMARKLGVVTYRSAMEWDGRFGRVRLESESARTTSPSAWNSRSSATWKATRAASCTSSTRTATCISAARWTGSTWPSTPAATSWPDWPRSASKNRCPSACTPTSCSRCSNSSRWRRGWPRGAPGRIRRPALAAGPRRLPGRHRAFRPVIAGFLGRL
jgi:homoserine O-acetyltransferase